MAFSTNIFKYISLNHELQLLIFHSIHYYTTYKDFKSPFSQEILHELLTPEPR